MIIHAKGQGTAEIHLSMWPYALKIAAHVQNYVPNAADTSSHLEAFVQIAVSPKFCHYRTFCCPAYMFATEDEQGRAKKWEGFSVLGIYLGPSTHHA